LSNISNISNKNSFTMLNPCLNCSSGSQKSGISWRTLKINIKPHQLHKPTKDQLINIIWWHILNTCIQHRSRIHYMLQILWPVDNPQSNSIQIIDLISTAQCTIIIMNIIRIQICHQHRK
jgi:hypothetical protein